MSSDRAGPGSGWKAAVKRSLALPWRAGFAALGRLAPPRTRRWTSPGRVRVLVVAPHPDDEVAGCGGTLLLHRACDDAVTVAYATDGRASRAHGLGPAAMARRRRLEADTAARILDATPAWLGLPEGTWSESDLAERLATLVAELDPAVVYAPSRVDFHPEHARVARALARALDRGRPDRLVRVYQVQVPLTARLTDTVAATGPVAQRSRAALEAYATQLGSLRRCLRMKRYAALRHRAGEEAEAFWEVTAAAYASIHRHADTDVGRSPYRGVRDLPLTDPLAYLLGRGARRRLAAAARA